MANLSKDSLSLLIETLTDYENALKAVYHDGELLNQNELNKRINAAP